MQPFLPQTKVLAIEKSLSPPCMGCPVFCRRILWVMIYNLVLPRTRYFNVLFNKSSLLYSNVSCVGKEYILHAFILKDLRVAAAETASFAACIFLEILMYEHNGICVPQNDPANRSLFLDVKLLIIRNQLLEMLSLRLDEYIASSTNNTLRKHAKTWCLLFSSRRKYSKRHLGCDW